ncbi:hypothetical protein HDE_13518 [Halotydeus destructor]|nr:hypothetical protein HDE_13518 [Halotydeus destructor]
MEPGVQLESLATGEKLRKLTSKKEQTISKLDMMAATHIAFFIASGTFILFTIYRLATGSFDSGTEKLHFTAHSAIGVINLIAVSIYWYGCTFRKWHLVVYYITLNSVYIFISVLVNLYFILDVQTSASPTDGPTSSETYNEFALFVIIMVLEVVNSLGVIYVNIYMRKLKVYTRNFSRTLSSSRSRSTSQSVRETSPFDNNMFDDYLRENFARRKGSSRNGSKYSSKASSKTMPKSQDSNRSSNSSQAGTKSPIKMSKDEKGPPVVTQETETKDTKEDKGVNKSDEDAILLFKDTSTASDSLDKLK